jgi:hypothetical protein
MSDINKIFDVDKKFSNIERREELTELMHELQRTEKNCFSCKGYCCTFEHNSMLVTPIEALDAYRFLKKEKRLNQELITHLKETIQKFRLDNELSIGNGREFRRNYTCPFFNFGPRGCSIEPESKPYGCLGFNALETEVSTQGHCTSNLDVLSARDERCSSNESMLSEQVRNELGLYWDKKNLPVALIHLIDKIGL